MLKRWNWLILLMIVLVPLWGCSDDEGSGTPPTQPQPTAFEVMAAAGAAYINDSQQCPGVLNAQVVYDNLDAYTVIDIRSQADYDAGHIEGAYHSTLPTLLADMASIPTDKPIVIACKTGQSAGHAKIALELMGYGDVYSLLFGMSAWNTGTLDNWSPNCADALSNPDNSTDENPNRTEQTFPTLSGGASTIVATRVADMLQNGFKGISYQNMLDNPAGLDDYYIINYFGPADYMGTGTAGTPGHIPGAYQFTPYQSMGIEEELKYIPADKKVVVYCWTGQHSSQVTAYLNMLGYDAYSLKFGSNNLFHGNLTAHKWTAAGAGHNFPLVTTPPSVATN